MNRLGHICLIAALSTGLCASCLFAQSSEVKGSTNADSTAQSPAVNAEEEDTVQSSRVDGGQEQQFVAALNGSGLILMEDTLSRRLFLGASFSGGWDSNPENAGHGAASGMYTLSPYLGIRAKTPRTQYLLQYQPTITGYSSDVYARQTMNTASAFVVRDMSDRWKWDLKATGSYGQDSTRFLAPQQTVVVGEVPGTGPNAASYLPNAGTVTYIDGTLALHFRRSERDAFALSASNSFNRNTGFNEESSVASTRLSSDRGLSPTLGLTAYGQASHYYGSLNCESFGGGIGVRWQARERTFFSLSGGPQLNTSICGKQQGFSYSAAFSTRLSRKSQMYMLSDYQPMTSYLGPGLWQRSASGGYQWQATTMGTLSVDLAYVSSNTLAAVSSYHGTYFDCVYSVHLRHGVTVLYSYRGAVSSAGGTSVSRNVAQFSLVWSSNVGQLFQ